MLGHTFLFLSGHSVLFHVFAACKYLLKLLAFLVVAVCYSILLFLLSDFILFMFLSRPFLSPISLQSQTDFPSSPLRFLENPCNFIAPTTFYFKIWSKDFHNRYGIQILTNKICLQIFPQPSLHLPTKVGLKRIIYSEQPSLTTEKKGSCFDGLLYGLCSKVLIFYFGAVSTFRSLQSISLNRMTLTQHGQGFSFKILLAEWYYPLVFWILL